MFRWLRNQRQRLDDIESRLELIEEAVDINSFMASDKIVTADGTIGSTVPPDVARYQELKAKVDSVGVGSTAPVGVGSTSDDSSVGVGSTAPATTETAPVTSPPVPATTETDPVTSPPVPATTETDPVS